MLASIQGNSEEDATGVLRSLWETGLGDKIDRDDL